MPSPPLADEMEQVSLLASSDLPAHPDVQYSRVACSEVLSDTESLGEVEQAQPWHLGRKATAAVVVCCMGLFGLVVMFLLSKGFHDKTDAGSVMELALIGHNRGSVEEVCLACESSTSAYHTAATALSKELPMMGVAAHKELLASGYRYVKGWMKSKDGGSDIHFASWWKKYGACVISFQGEDSLADLTHASDQVPINKWFLEEVHQGLESEMKTLLFGPDLNHDLQSIGERCHSVMVTGHSLGGGLAQLFTIMINEEHHYTQLHWKVNNLYAFGAMPATSSVDQKNYHAADGCFPGALYFTASRDIHGIVRVDMAKEPSVGAPKFKPIKYIKKVLLFEVEAPIEIQCGEDLPDDIEPCLNQEMHDPRIYASRLGCGHIDDLRLAKLAGVR